jgi:hypothetical protein
MKTAARQWMLDAWAERGQAVPESFLQEVEGDAADEEPQLSWLEMRYLELFNDASTCRPSGFAGILPIPATSIWQVLRERGWEGVEAETASRLIRRLDAVTIEQFSAKT